MESDADGLPDFDLDEEALHDLDDAVDEEAEHGSGEEFADEPTRPRMRRGRKPRPDTRPEDHELVARMRARDPAAWRLVLDRADGKLRCLVKRKFATALETVFSSDTIDEIMADFRALLMRGDMALLADWDHWWSREMQLSSFLAMIVLSTAYHYFNHAKIVARHVEDELDKARMAHAGRGERWAAGDQSLTVPVICEHDPKRHLTHVWYGEDKVIVYEEGNPVDWYWIGLGWESKVTACKVRREMFRRMRSGRPRRRA